nr:unnamed protein product [Callosobruchus chinensis]
MSTRGKLLVHLALQSSGNSKLAEKENQAPKPKIGDRSQVEQHYSKNDTPEDGYGVGSGVTSDPEDELFGEVEDYSSDSYMPSASNSSESGVEESVCDAGFGKHVTAEDAHTDQVFLEKRELVKKKVFEKKEKNFRKRERAPHTWKRNLAAKAREQGHSYISQKTKKTMPSKQIKQGTLCKDTCRLKCSGKFDLADRSNILKRYYSLDVNAKNVLLFKSIKILPVQRPRYSISYNKKVELVCKEALCSLYQFSKKKVEVIQNKLKSGQCAPSPDERGCHSNRPHKLDETVVNCITNHILKFPSEASHYSRNHNPHRKYLSPVLNISIMYKLYLQECDEEDRPKYFKCSYKSYNNIFSTKFNLGFGHPKSDTCSTCDSGQGTEEHTEKYKLAFEKQKIDRALATENQHICYVTVDLQQTMPLPKLTTSKAFYLRQMWFYNFGVHAVTAAGHQAYFFNWTEDLASRGSVEIGSCILRFVQQLRDLHGDRFKHLNKNFNIISLYQYFILNGWFEIIDHKFPEVGHSYLDSDRDFGRIEQKLRREENIYVPDQYRQIIQQASPKNSVLTNMKSYFYDIDKLGASLHLTNKKKNTTGQKVNVRDNIKWFRINEFGSYLYKESLNEDEPFMKVNILKTGSRIVSEVEMDRLEEKRDQQVYIFESYTGPLGLKYEFQQL